MARAPSTWRGPSPPRSFAPDDDDRTTDLVRRRLHPDVVEFEPERTVITVEQARSEIIPEVWSAPIESTRKVVLLLEAERLQPEAANALLKTFEEPPERTVIVLVSEAPDQAPRHGPVPTAAHRPRVARRANHRGGATSRRGRRGGRTAGRPPVRRPTRSCSRSSPPRHDPCHRRVRPRRQQPRRNRSVRGRPWAADEMLDAVHAAVATVKDHYTKALAEFDEETAAAGYQPARRAPDPPSSRRTTAGPGTPRPAQSHDRGPRRPRVPLPRRPRRAERDPTEPRPGAPHRRCTRLCPCTRRLSRSREALEFNPNEGLLLERLALHLP